MDSPAPPSPLTTVFFDGACHLCSREIEHYRQRDTHRNLRFVDIAGPHFDAAAEGLDPVAVNRELHVRTPSGELVTAVAAFAAIWSQLPGYQWLSRLAVSPSVSPVLGVGYRAFSAVRPYLPRRERDTCESDACAARQPQGRST